MSKIVCYDYYGNIVQNLTQWDTNRTLKILNWEYDVAPVVHFTNRSQSESYEYTATLEGNTVSFHVPNSMLQKTDTILLFIIVPRRLSSEEDEFETETIFKVVFPIQRRSKPEGYVPAEDPDVTDIAAFEGEVRQLLQDGLDDIKESVDGSPKGVVTPSNISEFTNGSSHEKGLYLFENFPQGSDYYSYNKWIAWYDSTETPKFSSPLQIYSVDAYSKSEADALLDDKQDTLVSQTNIKSINGESLLGSGNLTIDGGSLFVATYTESEGTYTCDKTLAQILSAIEDGNIVVADVGGVQYSLTASSNDIAVFSLVLQEGGNFYLLTIAHEAQEITVVQEEIGGGATYTAGQNITINNGVISSGMETIIV